MTRRSSVVSTFTCGSINGTTTDRIKEDLTVAKKHAEATIAETHPAPAEHEAAPVLREAERGEKAELVRKLLAEHPTKTTKELARLFNEEAIKLGINMQEAESGPTFSNARSKQKAAAGGGGGAEEGSENGAVTRVRQRAVGRKSELTMTQLVRVKQAMDEFSSIEDFQRDLEFFAGLADDLGGLDHVRECLEFWMNHLHSGK